jgi:preprotein translocase subunit SecG
MFEKTSHLVFKPLKVNNEMMDDIVKEECFQEETQLKKSHLVLIAFLVILLLILVSHTASAEAWISVTSPSAGDIFYVDDEVDIEWDSYDLSYNSVTIELYENGYYDTTIASWTSDDGFYEWDTSWDIYSGSSGSYYQIRIADYYDDTTYAMSNSFYVYDRSITVTDPSSGDSFFTDEKEYIRWDSEGAGSHVSIELCRSGYHYSTITSSTYNDGVYSWSIPNDLSVGYYTVKITSTDYSGVFDSSSSFYVDERSIEVTSPSSDDVLFIGESEGIQWHSDNAGSSVNIKLYKSGSFITTIESSTNNDGYFSWDVPNDLSVGYYTVKITSTDYSGVFDSSSSFYVDERSIEVTSPSSGDTFYKGDSERIRWNHHSSGSNVKISLYRDGSRIKQIDSSAYNNGYYSWEVPDSLSIGDYKIMISSTSYEDVFDTSESFHIDSRWISVNYPSDGEIVYMDDDVRISWASHNVGSDVKIELYQYGYRQQSISYSTNDDGSYQWSVPTHLSEGEYTIKITSKTYDHVYDFSHTFTIHQTFLQKIFWPMIFLFFIGLLIGGIYAFKNKQDLIYTMKSRSLSVDPKSIRKQMKILTKTFNYFNESSVVDIRPLVCKAEEFIKAEKLKKAIYVISVANEKLAKLSVEKKNLAEKKMKQLQSKDDQISFENIENLLKKHKLDDALNAIDELEGSYTDYVKTLSLMDEVQVKINNVLNRIVEGDIDSTAFSRAHDNLKQEKKELEEDLWSLKDKLFKDEYEKPF